MSPEWLALTISILVSVLTAGAVYGVLSERVRRQGTDLELKIDRQEFEAGMTRLEELHKDLREIRDLLLSMMANKRGDG